MKKYVSFRCTACQAKLKASARLVGQARPCPACREHVVLQPVAPAPADSVLVFEDLPLPSQAYPGSYFQA
jgi:hypothetical protein